MKKLTFLVFAVAACSLFAGSRQLMVDQEKPEMWKGMVEYKPEFARGKGPCFLLFGKYPTPLIYNKYLPVSPGKTYVLKASFRTLDPKLPASAYLGLELYDGKKRMICFRNLRNAARSESKVVSANKGDNFLIVKKFPTWKTIKVAVVAFHAKADFSDIPNFDLSPQMANMELVGEDKIKINLKRPLKKSYPAGTDIRLHSPWATTMYFLGSGWMPAGEGKSFTAVIRGFSDKPETPRDKFWKTTKYVRPFIWFGNWSKLPKPEAKLLVDGFSFEEIDTPEK